MYGTINCKLSLLVFSKIHPHLLIFYEVKIQIYIKKYGKWINKYKTKITLNLNLYLNIYDTDLYISVLIKKMIAAS